MKRALKDIRSVGFNELRDYLFKYNKEIAQCWSIKSLFDFINNHPDIYENCLNDLYNSRNYEELEYNIRIMNVLFNNDSYNDVKKDLYNKLNNRYIGLEQYLVLRHLIDFNVTSFDQFIYNMSLSTDIKEIIRICVIEDEYYLAYNYLKLLDNYDNEAVLDLLFQYSPLLYIKLQYHYKNKNKHSYSLQQN